MGHVLCRQFVIDCKMSDSINCWVGLLLSAIVHVNKRYANLKNI